MQELCSSSLRTGPPFSSTNRIRSLFKNVPATLRLDLSWVGRSSAPGRLGVTHRECWRGRRGTVLPALFRGGFEHLGHLAFRSVPDGQVRLVPKTGQTIEYRKSLSLADRD